MLCAGRFHGKTEPGDFEDILNPKKFAAAVRLLTLFVDSTLLEAE